MPERGLFAESNATAKMLAKKYRADIDKMVGRFNGKPWANEKWTREEQLAAFGAVADDPITMTQLVRMTQAGFPKPLQAPKYPRSVIEENIAMEARRRGR